MVLCDVGRPTQAVSGRQRRQDAAEDEDRPERDGRLHGQPAGDDVDALDDGRFGDLIADAGDESKTPFHGYRFKIIAPREPNGFALVAWPATYDVTGVMTFVVNQDGIVREKDLGPDTNRAASAMTSYDPDKTWTVVQ